jgi:hypothetical protein
MSTSSRLVSACKEAYANTHNRGLTWMDDRISEVKKGYLDSRKLTDVSVIPSEDLDTFLAFSDTCNLGLTKQDFGIINQPSGVAAGICVSWLQGYFACFDMQPNREDEIHIDDCCKRDIYLMYKLSMKENNKLGDRILSKSSFYNLWKNCFDHVKIRKYKAVHGKCTTCAMLSEAKLKAASWKERKLYSQLFAHHRYTFMKERRDYYTRRYCNFIVLVFI